MKILFIAHSYAPLNAISTYRVDHWIKYWLRDGHEVTLLTTKKYGFEGPLDLVCKREGKFELYEIDYLPTWFTKRINFLKQRKSTPTISSNETPKKNSRIKIWILSRLLYCAYFLLGSFFHPTMFWARPAIRIGKDLVRQNSFDLLVSSFGPAATHIVANKISAASPNLTWVADYRDLWSLNHLPPKFGALSWIERKIEARVIARASHCTAVSTELSQQIKREFGKNCVEIKNGYDPEEYIGVGRTAPPIYFDNDKVNIVYAGMIYPGRRDPTPLFDAIKYYKMEARVKVHFYGNKMAGLEDDVRCMGLENCVSFHGYRERRQLLSEMSSADALLFLESGEQDASGVLTGKLFEYIALRKPILALGIKEEFQSARIIKDFGIGMVAGKNHERISEFLDGPDSYYTPNEVLINSVRRDLQAREVVSLAKHV